MNGGKQIEGVIVQIFDSEYEFASAGGDADQIQQVAAYVDQKMREISAKHKGRVPRTRLAVWAAMEIAAELMATLRERSKLSANAHKNLDRLTRLVEERASMSAGFSGSAEESAQRHFLQRSGRSQSSISSE